MADFTRNFIAGRMNKVVDQRLLPEGEYVDAMNVRMGSTENAEVGVIENTKGNISLTSLTYLDGTPLSTEARCIGAIDDSANETLYWFVHDPAFTLGATGKLDLIVSYNVLSEILTYHIVSIDDGSGVYTTLNFNPAYLITGINIIDDLLFWTDDYNAPRFINIRPTRNRYPNPISNIDELDPEAILVIKKPPVESPTITLTNNNGQQNFLESRFISFAYRYKYADGEYSATSQWSAPAFIPRAFQFDTKSMLNIGMLNAFNTAIIHYNTGGHLVTGIDLLFKKTDNNIIKIIEQIDKAHENLPNDQEQAYVFDNSKIFTILNEAEILRLYDNVPRFAKAQTIMGNRLMYGNYVENYDLTDITGQTTYVDYETVLVSESIGFSNIGDTESNGLYNIDPSAINTSVDDCIISFDLGFIDLDEGSSISIDMTINHFGFTGYLPYPTETTTDVAVSFSFFLQTDYNDVYHLASSPEFQAAIGTIANIEPVYNPSGNNSCDGSSMTDFMNCSIPQVLGTFEKYASGINGVSQPIKIITSPGSSIIGLQIIAMEFVDNVLTPVNKVYEYYSISQASVSYQKIANSGSLHSNRGYEVGLIYMDEFNRATTSLVSSQNSVYVPCLNSGSKNSIQVTIPITQRAPSWAKRYKFVIKPDQENYETIYVNVFFQDPNTNNAYLLLEGENAVKVEPGDRLNIKSDTNGIIQNCTEVTVLEKKAQAVNFLAIPGVIVPSGVYMKVLPNNFSLEVGEDSVITFGVGKACATNGSYAFTSYPMNLAVPTDPLFPLAPVVYEDYTVPAGSIINWNVDWVRLGARNCTKSGYIFEKRFVASRDYDNMYDWFIGDNIDLLINTGASLEFISNEFIPGTETPIPNTVIDGVNTSVEPYKLVSSSSDFPNDIIGPFYVYNMTTSSLFSTKILNVDSSTKLTLQHDIFTNVGDTYKIVFRFNSFINYWKFYRNPTNNQLTVTFTSFPSCNGSSNVNGRRVCIYTNIQVIRANNLISFETQPSDSLPNVFFENNLSFEIDALGNHMGNEQDQDITLGIPGIVNTEFYNCFAFGNGVESYKIRDSILGMPFNFGERVTTVAAQDYKTADRFSDITYSGIYNGESNINKLNEFNLGLSNFKHCEASFGEIQLLDGRTTDVLVLQEDKISYVLAEKNLLSDASAGGIITASPAVLGTQIARTEKYGISFNPESYVQWGFDRFFTDAKRGAVLQLKGGENQNEELVAISNQNMRTWFRDKFNDSFNTQKLGGFDPYMNEYVLCMNDQLLPTNPQCLSCGVFQTFTLSFINRTEPKSKTYCVDFGAAVGYTTIDWEIISIQEGTALNVDVLYNGVTTSSGPVDIDGQISFTKDLINIETAQITLTYTGDMVVNMFAGCPSEEPMTIYEVVITDNSDAGQTIWNQYRYTFVDYIGSLISNLVTFISGTNSPLVSRYNSTTGIVGTNMPPEGSIMRLSTNQISPANYVFNIAQNKFRYLRSYSVYGNNNADINTMLSVATTATPNLGSSPLYYADFIVPSSSLGTNLYLIWDLRDSISTELCYVADNATNPCCDCNFENYYLTTSFSSATSVYKDADLSIFADNGFYSTSGVVRELVDGVLLPAQVCVFCPVAINLCLGDSLQDVCCGCDNACASNYVSWLITNPNAYEVIVGFYNAEGIYQEVRVPAEYINYTLCSVGIPTCSNSNVVITFKNCDC